MIGALKLDGKKEASLLSWKIKRPYLPEVIRIPLSISKEFPQQPIVQIGDKIIRGQKVAEPLTKNGVAAFSGIDGVVSNIAKGLNYLGDLCDHIEIKNKDPFDRSEPKVRLVDEWEDFSEAQVLGIVKDTGLLMHDFSLMPMHLKIKLATPIDSTLVINGCESEPYLTAEHALMMSHPVEIIKAAELLRKTIGASKVIIAIENNKEDAYELIKSKIYFMKWDHFEVRELPSLYPQGDETVLLKSLFKHLSAKHPEELKKNSCVFGVSSIFSFFESIAYGKNFFEKPYTIGGECVVEPKNIWLPLGADVKSAFKSCRGLLREPGKVIFGGPMQGKEMVSENTSLSAGANGLLALPKEIVSHNEKVEPCIRCGDCVEVCPEGLSPAMIYLSAQQHEFELARGLGADYCIECGNCAYVCPSHIELIDVINYVRN